MDYKVLAKSAVKKVWGEFGVTLTVAFLYVFAGLCMVKPLAVMYENFVGGWMFSTSEIIVIGSSIVWAGFFGYIADKVQQKYSVRPKP
jgi:hypothetical protein